VIQEELPPLIELISDDILSKKCHINLGPILNIYSYIRFWFFLNFNFNVNYKLHNLNAFIVAKKKLISVDLIVCSSILQRLQHIFKNASLRFDTLVHTFVNCACCSA
jgi:hypothetical protein